MIRCVIFGDYTGMHQPMEEEYLMKCVVDPAKRTFFLYSQGNPSEILASEYVAPPILTTTHTHEEQFIAPPTMSPTQNIKLTGGNPRPF